MEKKMAKLVKPVLDLKATGEKIKYYRNLKNLTVKDLQLILGMEKPQAIYNWESGINMPAIDNLIVLANLFDCKMDDLVETTLIEIEVYEDSFPSLKSA